MWKRFQIRMRNYLAQDLESTVKQNFSHIKMYSSVALGGAFKMQSKAMLTWCDIFGTKMQIAFAFSSLNGWILKQRPEGRRFYCKGREMEIEWALLWQFFFLNYYLWIQIFLTVNLHIQNQQWAFKRCYQCYASVTLLSSQGVSV